MSTTTAKTSNKAETKAKWGPVTPVVIVQKTFRMAETIKKDPLPRK
jgi:hypothetical protein